ncbi:MAG: carboxylating nicotinate-nucleotide diphosphorylase [Planctomycetes bacterium]|nr:carboxylating nicotinate-nucleotide diphosphorylase [Planctomycetota bacterium]
MTVQAGKRERDNLRKLLDMARAEDLGGGDITSELVPPETQASGEFVAREALVVCGAGFLEFIAVQYDGRIATQCLVEDGAAAEKGEVLARWTGPARGILAAERVALNFLQRLSGVATVTSRYVRAAAGTGAEIFDTRKTTPGWRDLEKYAVRAGGGRNHRRGLYDAVLIKDNHLAVLAKAGGADPIAVLKRELEQFRQGLPAGAFVELEVDSLDQLAAALALPVDFILLDNMSCEQLGKAVQMRDGAGLKGRLELEASGGITLENVRQTAQTGVERISVGALTHSAPAVDIALDIRID